jgi:AcrR family transcriptional regulator
MTEAALGRRERRRIETRKALSDAALKLFLERGFDQVTMAEIADEADVAVATLFNHVPDGKEALIFDEGEERRDGLVSAVLERPPGRSILDALEGFLAMRGTFREGDASPEFERTLQLIVTTPALREYQRRLWVNCQPALAAAIASESGRDEDDPVVRALARYILETPNITALDPKPRESLAAVFELLRAGWPGP